MQTELKFNIPLPGCGAPGGNGGPPAMEPGGMPGCSTGDRWAAAAAAELGGSLNA